VIVRLHLSDAILRSIFITIVIAVCENFADPPSV
jgi:hypothetical protein